MGSWELREATRILFDSTQSHDAGLLPVQHVRISGRLLKKNKCGKAVPSHSHRKRTLVRIILYSCCISNLFQHWFRVYLLHDFCSRLFL